MTAGPDEVDAEQIGRLLKSLHAGAPGHAVLASYSEKGQPEQPFAWGFYPPDDINAIVTSCRWRNEEEGRGVAVSVGTFRGNDRTESNISSLAAFAVDVDEKNVGELVAGASTAAAVIPELLKRLQARGLKPHALVSSGSGLHVYLLFERVFFPQVNRDRVKVTWERLARSVVSPDRFDLASVMRLPGTVNRKYGGSKRAHFLEDHTDLSRERYKFEYIENAVADVALPERISRISGGKQRPVLDRPDSLSPGEKRMVEFALATPSFRELRDGARAGRFKGSSDRSRIEFAYACRLFQLGFPEEVVRAEIGSCAKGSRDKFGYVDSTILKASESPAGGNSLATTAFFNVVTRASEAFYKYKEGALGFWSSFSLSVSNWPLPNVTLVMARAGGSKTTILLDIMSTSGGGVGIYPRVGYCGLFIRELLDAEHTIHDAFPGGMKEELGGHVFDYDRNRLPNSPTDILNAMPKNVRDFERDGRRVWGVGQLKIHRNPRALLLNSWSPYWSDARLEQQQELGEEGETPLPRAAAKFSPQEEFCLAGNSQHTRDRPPDRTP